MLTKISKMLDNVADKLEAKGLIKEAYEIDKISDQIDADQEITYGRSPDEIRRDKYKKFMENNRNTSLNNQMQILEEVVNLNEQLSKNPGSIPSNEVYKKLNDLEELWKKLGIYDKNEFFLQLPDFIKGNMTFELQSFLRTLYSQAYGWNDEPDVIKALKKIGVNLL